MNLNAPDDETIGPGTANPHLWLGCTTEEITDAATAVNHVRPYAAEIPTGLTAQLKAEQAAQPGRGVPIWQISTNPTDL